ncbi:UNVERIFIED_CONTAM: hypothetical protein Slati_4163300 [Sesamum latifolium]|uniref:Uncharacterized protein n=1 Tax=Sesamum latifolium TaxID=2727402 RepID=A0AAW2T9A6_9LAMI
MRFGVIIRRPHVVWKITSSTTEVYFRLTNESKSKGCFALVLCYQLWNNRNQWLWDNIGASPVEIISKARRVLFGFKEYNLSLQGPSKARATKCAWHPSPIGIIKLNFDGATFAETSTAGVGGNATFISKLHWIMLS